MLRIIASIASTYFAEYGLERFIMAFTHQFHDVHPFVAFLLNALLRGIPAIVGAVLYMLGL